MEYITGKIPEQLTLESMTYKLHKGEQKLAKTRSCNMERLQNNLPIIKAHEVIHNKIQLRHHSNEPIIDRSKSETVYAKPNSLDLPGNHRLNPSTLQCPKIGAKRVKKKYFYKYYVKDPFTVPNAPRVFAH